MDKIVDRLESLIAGVNIYGFNNGGIVIELKFATDMPAVLSTIADTMGLYDIEDVQITTNQAKGIVYVCPIDREED